MMAVTTTYRVYWTAEMLYEAAAGLGVNVQELFVTFRKNIYSFLAVYHRQYLSKTPTLQSVGCLIQNVYYNYYCARKNTKYFE